MVVVIKPSFIKHADEKKRPLSILTAQVSPDGARLATGGMDQTVKIWSTAPILDEEQEKNPNAKKLLSTLGSHNGNVLCVRWSPDGHYLASGSDDTIVIVWERDEAAAGRKVFGQVEENHEVWKATRRLVGHDSDVGALAWSADGYYLATGSVDTNVLIYETETFSLVKRMNHHADMVKGLAFDPIGEFLTTQSDDRSICVWRISDWSLVSQIRDPFVDAPNASWFRRLSWSPDGALLGIPNSVNNGVFVAGIMSRRNLDDGQGASTSLIGHENVVDVVAFNPACFVKDPKKENSANCFVLAVAARSGISVWMTSSVRPVVVFDTVVERDVLDLSWSSDGTTLYACSSEGAIAVMHFNLSELGNIAPAGTLETVLEASIRRYAQRSSSQPNSRSGVVGGTSARPNVLQPRKKGALNGTTGGLSRGSSEILPIPPPGAPQQITLTDKGKRRIKPAFLGTGGLVAQSLNARTASAFTASSTSNGASAFQPAIKRDNDVDMMDARAQAGASSRPFQAQLQHRTSLQDIGMPSWGTPQDQPVQNALQNGRKRKANDLDNHAYAYERDSMDLYPDNLRPMRPPGRTLGGDRSPTIPAYDGELADLRPAYLPKTQVSVPQEAMELAVPAIKAHMLVKWDQEDTEAETLEYRNYADPARSSEVAQINSKGQLQWVDYLPTAIVLATYSPTFSAVSCEDKSLNVYSPSGRRLMPTLVLDAPCSFLDAAGAFLLVITARGTLKIWDVRRRKATFKGTSVYPLISGPLAFSGQTPHNPPVINTAKVRMNGSPIVSLSNGTALTYDIDLDDWAEVSTSWWSKGSECWEGRVRSSTSTASKGVIKLLESEANDHLTAQQPLADANGEDGPVAPSIEGEEQARLGRADDWKMALTLGHLESRMQAAIALDSRDEYRANLVLYARKLAEEAFRGKAEELIKELMGPVYHRPGRDGSWQPNLLGVPKHTLLREVLNIFSKSKNLSRLGNDMQETLRKMTIEQ